MTSTISGHLPSTGRATAPARRVRHQVRDGLAVIAFSAAASTAVALALFVLDHVAG